MLVIQQRLSLPVNSRFRLNKSAEEGVATVVSRAGGIERGDQEDCEDNEREDPLECNDLDIELPDCQRYWLLV